MSIVPGCGCARFEVLVKTLGLSVCWSWALIGHLPKAQLPEADLSNMEPPSFENKFSSSACFKQMTHVTHAFVSRLAAFTLHIHKRVLVLLFFECIWSMPRVA